MMAPPVGDRNKQPGLRLRTTPSAACTATALEMDMTQSLLFLVKSVRRMYVWHSNTRPPLLPDQVRSKQYVGFVLVTVLFRPVFFHVFASTNESNTQI